MRLWFNERVIFWMYILKPLIHIIYSCRGYSVDSIF